MNTHTDSPLEIGYDVPAALGMPECEIQTPCLIIDLDAFERNVQAMKDQCLAMGMRHRVHGKMHKSADIARYQINHGGACGLCCQKVSEAEAFVREGLNDILITNQVRDPVMIDRLARLAAGGARLIVCVDDIENVAELSGAVTRHDTTLECLVEIDCGAGRCGVTDVADVLAIARAIDATDGLRFAGIQAYNGAMQHISRYEDRKAQMDVAIAQVKDTVTALAAQGMTCEIVGGGGTGSYYFEGGSGIYNELQCGSYAFMDADYGRILGPDGKRIDAGAWKNALFILTSIISHVKPGIAVCDAGLKSQSVDSGLPVIFGRADITYINCSDEHGIIRDPQTTLAINERLRLVPGHCDPTCNLHDWYVGVRGGRVETLWPVTARGKSF